MHDAKPTGITPVWVRPKEATRLSGLGTTVLYELMNSGMLRSIKIGRKRLISYASLQQLGEQQEKAA